MTPSQFKSHMQRLANQHRQAVDRYNQKVRQHNQAVRQNVQNVNRVIDDHNRQVRNYNARVRANRQRLAQALSRMQAQSRTVTTYSRFRSSVETLHRSYVSLESAAQSFEPNDVENQLLDLSEREDANSLDVMNALQAEGSARPEADDLARLRETNVDASLRSIEPDLSDRWTGALFSLHPQNPDAARHFCTSAREIFTSILERRAPDDAVLRLLPDCETVPETGRPTRRSRIRFALLQKNAATPTLEDFVEEDIDNIVELFGVFNTGTHGSAGRYGFEQLVAIKQRVEHGIEFLHHVFA
jgi:hypothetical protein